MDVAILRRYLRVRPSAFWVSLAASAGVILLGVLQGIVVAVSLAILLFFRRNWWPHGAVLGRVSEVEGWHDVGAYPDAEQLPGVVVYRWEAPLFFANAGEFRQQIRRLAREREPRWIVLQCEAVTDVDVTAGEMLEQLDDELNAAGIHLAFAELRGRLQELILRYGLMETLDRDHFYPTLEAALEAIEGSQGSAASWGRRLGKNRDHAVVRRLRLSRRSVAATAESSPGRRPLLRERTRAATRARRDAPRARSAVAPGRGGSCRRLAHPCSVTTAECSKEVTGLWICGTIVELFVFSCHDRIAITACPPCERSAPSTKSSCPPSPEKTRLPT